MMGRGNRKQRKDADTLDFFLCRPWDVNHGNCEQKLKLLWRMLCCVSDVTWSTKTAGCLQDWSAPVPENWTPLKWHPLPGILSLYKHFETAGAQGIHFLSIPRGLYGGIAVNGRESFSSLEYKRELLFSPALLRQPVLQWQSQVCHQLFPLIVLMPCFYIGVLVWKLFWEAATADLQLGEGFSIAVPEKWAWVGS